MKKFVYKFLAVAVSFVTAIAMIPLGSESVAYAETSQVTNNVKYFSTTMYNFDETSFNTATDKSTGKTKSADNFYFISSNSADWSMHKGKTGYVNYGDPGDERWENNNRRYAYNVLVQGIVENKLTSKGDIQFKYKNAGVFAASETDINGRDVYQNVQFPFVYTSDGYYTFDSASNHVHVDTSKKTGQQLTLYKNGQSINNNSSFFPFNKDGASSTDIHFGMNMSVPFYMNASDLNENNTTNPTKFEFSGDDDVWVFVNGKLVLDLGGIHDAIGASINFNTGAIEYKYTKDSGVKVKARQGNNSSISEVASKNLYKDCGITRDELTSGENNLQIFYLERGGSDSNCKIKFNLKQKDTLEVSKALGATTPYTSSDFQFQLLKKNENSYNPVSNKTYALYNGSSLVEGNYATDAEGKFTLKAGQHANFTENTTGDYKVVELTGGYDTEWKLTKQNNTSTVAVDGKISNQNAYAVPIDKNSSGGVTKYVLSCVNSADLTLADDTIVLDYGKPVQYDVRKNDSSKSKENGTIAGIGTADLATDAKTLDSGYKGAGTDVTLNNGNIKIDKQGIVTYTPTKYMSSVDKANYAVNYKVDNGKTDRYAYATVNVLPATSVYYEDDFGKINGSGNTVIKWTGKWTTANSEKISGNKYQGSDNKYQGSDNKQYGWDKSYENDSEFSNGSAQVTTIDGENSTATAEFTFTGTGVDVYTKTDNKTGTVKATLYEVKDGQETAKKGLIMDNKSISDKGNGYYQIPTLFFKNLTYGTYKVKITVTNQAGADRSTYYLDGIRVYNPLGVAPSDSIAQEAYTDAGEYNATYKTVRDILLDAKTFSVGEVNNGAVFIDETNDKKGNSTGNSGTTSDVIGTYKYLGAKNEVYLSSGQAIAFEINSGYENLFIGAKAPNGSTTMALTNSSSAKGITIKSASDMYYPITAKDGTNGKKYVVIRNNGSNILAITKIRATGVNYTMNVQSSANSVNYASTFSQLKVSETDSSGMVLPEGKGDVDIDNPGDKDNNQNKDDNKDDDNANKPNTIWNKIVNALKKWFSR